MHLRVNEFNLQHTLESGQFFRYYLKDGFYYVISGNNFFKIRQQGKNLEFLGTKRKFVQQFLGLNHDFETVKKQFSKDKYLNTAMKQYSGLRIMKQNQWETLISFICSSASNIPKITKNVNLLAENFGKKINFENETAFAMPMIGEMNDLAKIKNCKVGFRAKYLFEANRIPTDFFDIIKNLNYTDAVSQLTTLNGVGEKIADCVLLFGCNRLEAFPVDVWIKRVVQELYFDNKETNNKEIKKFGQEKFGKNAGYANQYLYHWRRNQ
ncbi:hypothetical protein HY485_05415 [Candidatus Woesearchaeota archaeon]|nr:hypothetical protein [Candidatus Woesearchaeota archaeon]